MQVISLEEPQRLPAWMEAEVTLAEHLSDTSERRKDWYHFYAAGGLPGLQRASLAHADLKELHFNRRATGLPTVAAGWWWWLGLMTWRWKIHPFD